MRTAWSSSVSDTKSDSERRYSTPTFWMRPGKVYFDDVAAAELGLDGLDHRRVDR